MSTKLASVALVVFTALTLTHAAFVDYRSGTTENQRGQDKSVSTGPMQYLQTRKFGVETMMSQTQGAGAWSGSTRSRWTESGLCCGVFELLTRMKGGKTRIALLKSLTQPKNKLQLAYDLEITWKAVDAHISKLLTYGLVSEILVVGTSRLYGITEKGRNALALVQDCARVEMMNHQ